MNMKSFWRQVAIVSVIVPVCLTNEWLPAFYGVALAVVCALLAISSKE